MAESGIRDDRTSEAGAATWPPDRVIVAWSRQTLVDHYENRDIDGVMRHLAPDMTWIGPLACQHARSAEDMRSMLEPEYGTRAEMFDESWGIRVAGGVRVVIGMYSARIPESAASNLAFMQSATFVWALTPVGPRVVHLHLSSAYDVPPRLDAPVAPDDNALDYLIDAVAPAVPRKRLRFEAPGGEACYTTEDRILCFDATKSGCTVVCENRSFPERERLTSIAKTLPPCFVRTHRSCIVNACRVTAVRRFEVELDDGSLRPIAERRYLEVAEAVEAVVGRSLRAMQ